MKSKKVTKVTKVVNPFKGIEFDEDDSKSFHEGQNSESVSDQEKEIEFFKKHFGDVDKVFVATEENNDDIYACVESLNEISEKLDFITTDDEYTTQTVYKLPTGEKYVHTVSTSGGFQSDYDTLIHC